LPDGRGLSVRSAVHDAVLLSVAAAAGNEVLSSWLRSKLPKANDPELGYAFVRESDGEHVSRWIDLRVRPVEEQTDFSEAAKRATPMSAPYAPLEDVQQALERLREMLDHLARGEPPLEFSDLREIPPIRGRET
jgi:hypothetical protein